MISAAIIMNTIVLALDAYPVNDTMQHDLDLANIAFFSLFLLEMLVKLGGMGPRRYIRDRYNIFDAIIVTLSVIDVAMSFSSTIYSGKGAISAFRAFRLMRIFKLVKSWGKFL